MYLNKLLVENGHSILVINRKEAMLPFLFCAKLVLYMEITYSKNRRLTIKCQALKGTFLKMCLDKSVL